MKRKSENVCRIEKTKRELRQSKLIERNTLSQKEIKEKSVRIAQRVIALQEWKNACTIFFYVSFGSEVNTHALIEKSLRQKKKVVIPKIVKKKLYGCTITDFKKDLHRGCFGILEPKHTQRRRADKKTIDLVIVPGICFDVEKGARVGFGGGYFDRFLRSLKKKAVLLGLAFEKQLVKSAPCLSHDVTMDIVITEKRVLRFRKDHS